MGKHSHYKDKNIRIKTVVCTNCKLRYRIPERSRIIKSKFNPNGLPLCNSKCVHEYCREMYKINKVKELKYYIAKYDIDKVQELLYYTNIDIENDFKLYKKYIHDNTAMLPLHFATILNRYDIVKIIIENKITPFPININIVDYYGETILFKAIRNKNLKMIDLIINAGIDINIKNLKGRTVIDLIKYYNLKNAFNKSYNYIL